MNWYYESGGQQQGPVTDADLDRLLAEGKITVDTLVWREGMSGWTPLRTARPAGTAPTPDAPPGTGAPAPVTGPLPSATSGSDVPQPGWIRCSLTGRYFPPSEIIYLEGKPYSAAAKPQVVATLQSGGTLPTFESGRNGPAWEQRQTLGAVQAIIQTCKGVILTPTATFATMRREGGIQTPLIFNLIVGSAAGIVVQILTSIAQMVAMGGIAATAGTGGGPAPAGVMVGAGLVGMIFGVIMTPVQVAIGAFVAPGITHACLVLLKGANRPFETTFRAINYLAGGLAPAQLVFGVGMALATLLTAGSAAVGGAAVGGIAIIAFPFIIWWVYLSVVAVSESQEISRGKATAAVLLPGVVCCGLILFIALAVGGIAAMNSGR